MAPRTHDQEKYFQFQKAIKDENIQLVRQMIMETKTSNPNESIVNLTCDYFLDSPMAYVRNHKIAKMLLEHGAKMGYGNYYRPPILKILLRFPILEEFIFHHVVNNYQEFMGELMISEQVYDKEIHYQNSLRRNNEIEIKRGRRILKLCEYVYLEKKNPYGNILLSKKQMVLILQNNLNVNRELIQLCLGYFWVI